MLKRPLVEPHLGPVPKDLLIEEITEGDGDVAIAGKTAIVHYVGVSVSSGD
ncbi:MAG: hypothetical protein ACYCPT_07400 [Acidimicrobiales bacterium]